MNPLQMRYKNSDFGESAFRLNAFSQIDPKKTMTILKHQMAIQKALNMIKERIQDPPTLFELANSTGLSRTYLSYVFKEVTGMRLQEYLTQIRLEKAKDLLRNIDLKIKQIAHEVGFSDSNYFCRAFKRKTGLTPTNWRLINIFTKPRL